MPLIWADTMRPLRYGSSPPVVRLRPQFGSRSRSVCGPNMPVTMNERDSVPSVWPQAFASPVSNEDARPISVVGAVEPRAFGPDVLSTPCASVQQIGAIDGLVGRPSLYGAPVAGSMPPGALTGPTLWQAPLGPSCSSFEALAISARVGGLFGSSCAIRPRTAGVYGAAASTAGDCLAAGSATGN